MAHNLQTPPARKGRRTPANLEGELVELTVIFRNMLPSEELMSFIKQTLEQRDGSIGDGVQVSIEKTKEDLPSYYVGLSTALQSQEALEYDQNPYSAVLNALRKFESGAPSLDVAS